MNLKYGAFDNHDIRSTLILVKNTLPQGYKWGIYLDNASVHVHDNVMSWCESNDVPVTFNAKYRPDLMGIEFFWRLAKVKYRQELTEAYVRVNYIDNQRLVTNILNSIDNELAKKWAIVGWQHLYNAEIIPANIVYNIDEYNLQGEYLEKMKGKYNPQDSHLIHLNARDKTKIFVSTIFTAPLPKQKKRDVLWDGEDWSPHK